MKRKTAAHLAEALAYIALTLALLLLLQALVVPKFMSFPYEGAMMAEYYEDEASHDVIFLGDCEYYEGISPVTLWEEYGISSYVRGSPQQLMWQSYYVLLDTLKHEKPKAVVLNAIAMKNEKADEEAYTRMALDGLRDVKYRLEAAKVSMRDGESLASYVFPLLRFHSRWTELNSDDIRYLFRRDPVSFNGYMMQTDVRPQTSTPSVPPLLSYKFPERCWEYLDKFVELCEREGIALILYKAPTDSWMYPWYDGYDEQLREYAEEHNILYVNGVALAEEMGVSMATDTYDEGVHLNVYGAEKCARYLGRLLRDEYGLADRRGDAALEAAWEPVCRRYHEERDGE